MTASAIIIIGILLYVKKRGNELLEIIDITHPLHSGMIKFNAPWHIDTDIQPLGTIATAGRNTSVITIGSHAGTHMDAAKHFIEGGESIDQIPLDKLIGPVTIIDFSSKGCNSCVTTEDLSRITITKRMLFYFGWDKYWNTNRFYKEYPWFTEDSAQYLVNHGVCVVGMDTPSPDNSSTILHSSEDSLVHKTFLSQGITLIEYLSNLGLADFSKIWNLFALPLPIKDCDGSPIRACLISEN